MNKSPQYSKHKIGLHRTALKTKMTSNNRIMFTNSTYQRQLRNKQCRSALSVRQLTKHVPKQIIYDKETLYYEVIELKSALNKLQNQNIKLKTRLKISENGKSKQTKGRDEIEPSRYDQIYLQPSEQIQNIQESEETQQIHTKLQGNSTFKRENSQTEHSNEYQKISQVKQLNHILSIQNKRLISINEELSKQLENYLQSPQGMNVNTKQNEKQNDKIDLMHIEIMNLQAELRRQKQSTSKRQAQFLNTKSQDKKKILENSQDIQKLKNEMVFMKQSQFRSTKTEQKMRYTSFQSYHTITQPLRKQKIDMFGGKKYIKDPFIHSGQSQICKKLTEQNQRLKQKLSKLEEKLVDAYQCLKQDRNSEYNHQKSKNFLSSQIKSDSIKQSEQFSPQFFITSSNNSYQPNMIQLNSIKTLLTYRMKNQNYTFFDLQRDFQKSKVKEFSFIDVCQILINEPFYLSVEYSKSVIKFILQKDKPNKHETFKLSQLLNKLRTLIQDFDKVDSSEQEKIMKNCATFITQNHIKLRQQIIRLSNKNQKTITLQNLTSILIDYLLCKQEIDCIIGEISIFSEDISNLTYETIFQIFVLSADEEQRKIDIISQRQNEQNSHLGKSTLLSPLQKDHSSRSPLVPSQFEPDRLQKSTIIKENNYLDNQVQRKDQTASK